MSTKSTLKEDHKSEIEKRSEEELLEEKIRKEMADMKKEPVKKGIPLNWDTPEGMDK